jgi:XRE family transcriptional regulator, regulator of sulfur utilization
MHLGNTIKTIRKQQKKSQGEIAKQCDISQTYFSQIESEDRNPNLDTLQKISQVLKVPLPILFFLSMEEADIPKEKQEAFKLIMPTIKLLMNEFYTVS